MNILLLHQIFALPEDGGGTRHYELARNLIAKGHKVTVIASNVNYLAGTQRAVQTEEYKGIRIIYARTYTSVHKGFFHRAVSFLSFAVSSFAHALRLRDIDIVWGTTPPLFQSLTALLISRIKNKPFVLEVRDLWVDFARELGVIKSGLVIRALKMLERVLYRSAYRIIVNSPGFIPYISRYTGRDKICLVPNGVTTGDFEIGNITQTFREEHGIGKKFIAIYLGNIGVANDIEMILDAAEQLKPYGDILIVLMGGGIKKESVRRDIAHRNLLNVLLLDTRPKAEMPQILAEADVCIASLKNIPMFRTTYPNKVFDYMAAQKPTVLAIDGVIREVIEASRGGICVPPGDSRSMADAVVAYYENPELRKTHGESARAYVKRHFERETIAAELERLMTLCYERR